MFPDINLCENNSIYEGSTDESNWVIPRKLMVGAYPANHLDWKTYENISKILIDGISTFVCLQSEFDTNITREEWENGSKLRPYMDIVEDILDTNILLDFATMHDVTDKERKFSEVLSYKKPSEIHFIHFPILCNKGKSLYNRLY